MAAVGAGLPPLLQSRVSMVYYVLLLLRCFSCSHTVLPKEHSLGVIFFLLSLLMFAVFSSKNPCISLLIVLCMIVYVTNKPTLTLTLTLTHGDVGMATCPQHINTVACVIPFVQSSCSPSPRLRRA